MDIFKNYVSNTLAANGNQRILKPRPGVHEGMQFIKIFAGGEYEYVFAYSDRIDSTFGNGDDSRCNDACGGWTIHALEYAVMENASPDEAEQNGFRPLFFGGQSAAEVKGGELVFTDPVKISVKKDAYICLKISFEGKRIPYHHESTVALFRKNADGWFACPEVPLAVFTGVQRQVKARIGFIGDSITQGCGTTYNGYKQYAAVVSERLGKDYAFWDMGLGYARGSDAATDGIWLYKAKQNDLVSVCFGVNDILQGHSADEVKKALETIVDKLKEAGVKVLLQTVPPFDYDEKNTKTWREINRFLKTELCKKADAFFDTSSVLSADGVDTPRSKYGSHPNDEGHEVWGSILADILIRS